MIIATRNLSKSFGTTEAVKTISITIEKGEVYGFIGLNGAGKTTLIRMLLGMIKPSHGAAYLLGEEVGENFHRWQHIGYLVETPYAYPQLTVRENLTVFYKLRNLNDLAMIDDVITRLRLGHFANKKAGVLSLGNQQRLGIAKALLHKPQVLLLDEPTNGLDPEGIAEVRTLLRELSSTGVTVLLSSHILGEVSKIADRIGIIHNGSLVKELSRKELENSLAKKVILNTKDNFQGENILKKNGYAAKINSNGELELHEDKAIEFPEQIAEVLCGAGLYPTKLLLYVENLEEFFLRTIR
jgi:ABC-2 type transport system ATP-binding protein